MTLFPEPRHVGARRVIDVSGDGRNNRGRPAADARDEAVRAGASINGLPILAIESTSRMYYRNNVIGGPGAFVVPAADLRDVRRRHPEKTRHRDFRLGPQARANVGRPEFARQPEPRLGMLEWPPSSVA